MGEIKYSPQGVMAQGAIATVCLASMLGSFADFDFLTALAGSGLFVALAFGTLISQRPALSWTPTILTINRMTGRVWVPWVDVERIVLQRRVTRVNFVPVASRMELAVIGKGLVFGTRTYRLPVHSLALGRDGFDPLQQALADSRSGHARHDQFGFGGARGASSLAEEPRDDSAPFDADAAIARYLANRGSAPEAAPAPIPAAAASAPLSPVRRPQFGRRAV